MGIVLGIVGVVLNDNVNGVVIVPVIWPDLIWPSRKTPV
jgi:hypothetical protein